MTIGAKCGGLTRKKCPHCDTSTISCTDEKTDFILHDVGCATCVICMKRRVQHSSSVLDPHDEPGDCTPIKSA